MVVGGSIHRLWQVDDHRAFGAEEHVEFRQVAVHQAGAEHLDDLLDHEGMKLTRIIRVQVDVIEPRCDITLAVAHQLHQQHAVEKVVGFGHSHAGIGQAEQRSDLGILPGAFLLLATIFAALGHGPCLTAATHLAAFLILGSLAKATFVGFLVDLGAAQLVAAAHHINRCFLAAHERSQHLVHQAVFDQGFNTFGRLHRCGSRVLFGQRRTFRGHPLTARGRCRLPPFRH